MDKNLQDIKIVIDGRGRDSKEEICILRAVRFIELLKRPTYLILRFSTETPAIRELIIPIIPYMELIIE